MPEIHSTAVVEKGAELAANVVVGPFAYIGAEAKIGAGTVIQHHATVEGRTTMGEGNVVFPYAFIGGQTQDLKYKGGDVGLTVGSRNVFREYCSVHMSTIDGTRTEIGDDNNLLGYSHVAHDAIVGNHLIMSGNAAIGGHAVIEDNVYIAWAAGISPFCRIGKYAIAGATAKVTQDIPPYMMADGSPAKVMFINKVRLEREGYSNEDIQLAKDVFKILYKQGLNRSQALEALAQHEQKDSWFITAMIAFAEKSERGFA